MKKSTGTLTSFILPIGLLCLFAVCSLLLILTGLNIYRKIEQINENDFEKSVVSNYLRTKIMQANSNGNVYLFQESGIEFLAIRTNLTSESYYETLICFNNGELLEAYRHSSDIYAEKEFSVIAYLNNFSFEINSNNLFTAFMENTNGENSKISVLLYGRA